MSPGIATNSPRIPLAIHHEIRRKYVCGEASLKDLSIKHEVSHATIRDWAYKEGWSATRKTHFERLEHQHIAAKTETPSATHASAKLYPHAEDVWEHLHARFAECKSVNDAKILAEVRQLLLDQAYFELHGQWPYRPDAPKWRRRYGISRHPIVALLIRFTRTPVCGFMLLETALK